MSFWSRFSGNKPKNEQKRLDYLWEFGFLTPGGKALRRMSAMHVRRAVATRLEPVKEGW